MVRKCIGYLFLCLSISCARPASFMSSLPRPVYDAHPEYIELYDKAWELAYSNIDTIPGIPAPVYMDEAHRSDRIWVWDTCLMGLFCKYCPSVFPGIQSLDNFYGILLSDADVPLPKVIGNKWCGKDEGKMLPLRVQHPDNPPLLAWTEYCYALQTGDLTRLERVFSSEKYLQHWYQMFDSFDPSAPRPHGAGVKVKLKKFEDGYAWGGDQSGMDNTPRGRTSPDPTPRDRCPDNPDLRWVDALALQGLSALCMSRIAGLLGDQSEQKYWQDVHSALSEKLNTLYWDEEDGFYYDCFTGGEKCRVKTIASWWPVLAEMTGQERAGRMADHLRDSLEFGGSMPTPSLSRNDVDFIPDGGYWRGSIWLPTTYMALKATDSSGEYDLARSIASSLLEHMYKTYVSFDPHTIWECYSPTEHEPARNKQGELVRPDFCGWSALGPISIFIEDVIGIKEANAFDNTLACAFDKHPEGRVGVRNYRFGNIVCSIIATDKKIKVTTNKPFTLITDGRNIEVPAGKSTIRR